MIIVREVFTCKPGNASKFAKAMKESMEEFYPNEKVRVLTDLVGEFHTVVMETQLNSLAEFEARMAAYRYDTRMSEKMKSFNFNDQYTSGRREIWQITN